MAMPPAAAPAFRIAPATPHDVPAILSMIVALADYEKLAHLCVATEQSLHAALFGPSPTAEVRVGWEGTRAIAFALFFHNFSTFLGRKGLYLEDLFVQPGLSRPWLRSSAADAPRAARRGARLRPLRMGRSGLERGGDRLLPVARRDVLPDWRITRVSGEALARLAARTPAAEPGA